MEVLSKMRSVRGEMGELIWLCCECDYSHIKKTNTFRHVEAKHVVCEYLCPICTQPNSCRNALKQHMIRLHSFSVNKWKTNKRFCWTDWPLIVATLWLGLRLILKIPGTLWSGPSIESEAMKKMIPMTDEMGLKMWQCSECDYRVKNSNDLRKHVERKHLECRVSCDICFQVFNCRYRLQQHHRSAHQNAFWPVFWNKSKIANNFLSANFNPIIKGEAPNYDQSIKSKMLETQDADGWKLWKCSDCDYTNKKTSHLYRHIERRHFLVTLSCEFCAQTFTCSQALATHQKHSCCSWDLISIKCVTQSSTW